MLCKASKQLEIFGIHDIFFVHETKSAAGKQMIDGWNISQHHSEYMLVYDKKHTRASARKLGLQLAKAEEKDFAQMLKLNAAIFGGESGFEDMLKKSMTTLFKVLSNVFVIQYFGQLLSQIIPVNWQQGSNEEDVDDNDVIFNEH